MKIWFMSDLHLELEPFLPEVCDADILILAGDTAPGKKGIVWLKSLNLDIPVLYILGNHEYYRSAYPKLVDDLRSLTTGTNISVLENDEISISGISFYGCTLWTDFGLFGNPYLAEVDAEQFMNDFKLIRKSPLYSKFRAADALAIHRQSIYRLREHLKNVKSKTVIVTHHAPSKLSVPAEHAGSNLNPAYASNLEDFILEFQPELWIHGHVHMPVGYTIGNTMVVANPRGYPNQRNNGFNPCRIIDV